jgi:hypothetical protein
MIFVTDGTFLSFPPSPPSGATAPRGPGPPHYRGFTITPRHTTLGKTPIDGLSARCIDLYKTTHKHSQETNIHAPGGIRIRSPSKQAAADPRLRPRGHRDRHSRYLCIFISQQDITVTSPYASVSVRPSARSLATYELQRSFHEMLYWRFLPGLKMGVDVGGCSLISSRASCEPFLKFL